MKVSWNWVNNGEEFDLPKIPIAGRRELIEREKEQAEVLAEYSLANWYQRCLVILAVKKVLDTHGVDEARRIWNDEARHYFSERAAEELLWDDDEWEECFESWLDKEVLAKFATKDPKEALEKSQLGMKDVNWGKLSNVITSHRMDAFVAQMHWRLKQKFDKLTVSSEGELPLTRKNLEKVLEWPEDEIKLRDAETGPRKKPVDWSEEMGHKTEEAIEKN